MVPEVAHLRYSERMKKLGLPSLEYRLIETYKIKQGYIKVENDKLFPQPPSRSQQLRGHSLKIYKRQARTETRRSIFSQRVVDKWNILPENIVMAPSVNSFKKRLNKMWEGGPDKFMPSCVRN